MEMNDRQVEFLPEEKQDATSTIGKLFLHGLGYSILIYLLGITSTLMVFFFIGISSVVGFLIALALLFMILGWSNGGIALRLWSVTCDDNWLILIVHGIVLLPTFIIVGAPAFFIQAIVSLYTDLVTNLIVTGVLVSVYAVVYGYLARRIASFFRTDNE